LGTTLVEALRDGCIARATCDRAPRSRRKRRRRGRSTHSLYQGAIVRWSCVGAGMPDAGWPPSPPFPDRVSAAPNGLFNGLIWPKAG